jgi:hypothetical protein
VEVVGGDAGQGGVLHQWPSAADHDVDDARFHLEGAFQDDQRLAAQDGAQALVARSS